MVRPMGPSASFRVVASGFAVIACLGFSGCGMSGSSSSSQSSASTASTSTAAPRSDTTRTTDTTGTTATTGEPEPESGDGNTTIPTSPGTDGTTVPANPFGTGDIRSSLIQIYKQSGFTDKEARCVADLIVKESGSAGIDPGRLDITKLSSAARRCFGADGVPGGKD